MGKSAKIVAPKGYIFKSKKFDQYLTRITLHVAKSDKKIGYVSLVRVRPGYCETHSNLDSAYHNKGLGALLYAKAIQYGLSKKWRVQSSGSSSSMAQRVWKGKTLRKYFSIKYKKNPHDTYYDKWYAYAK
jgi:hypothetical protein